MTTPKHPGSILNINEVEIGPVTWQIKYLDPERNTGTAGTCSTIAKHTMEIDCSTSRDAYADHLDTVWHELLHAMSNTYLNQNQLNETQVENMANAIEMFILTNPKFVKWMAAYADWQRTEIRRLNKKKKPKT